MKYVLCVYSDKIGSNSSVGLHVTPGRIYKVYTQDSSFTGIIDNSNLKIELLNERFVEVPEKLINSKLFKLVYE